MWYNRDMKRTPLKRKTPLKSKTYLQAKPKHASVTLYKAQGEAKYSKTSYTTHITKTRKTERKKTQKNCDDLLTPIIKKRHPNCLLCGKYTQVAHHFIRKSVSSKLRYEFDNLIPLCNGCHFRLHHVDEGGYVGRIIKIKGQDWFNSIEKTKREYTKHNYDIEFERLNNILKNE